MVVHKQKIKIFFKDLEYNVIGLQGGNLYSFQIHAVNRGGESPRIHLDEVPARDRIGIKYFLQVVSNLMEVYSLDLPHIDLWPAIADGITVLAGKTFTIGAKVSGRPYPTISWAKNAEDFERSKDVVQIHNGTNEVW